MLSVTLPSIPECAKTFSVSGSGIDVIASQVNVDAKVADRIALWSRVSLASPPDIDDEGFVLPPEPASSLSDALLEHVADCLAISARAKRHLSACTPCIAFSECLPAELERLNESQGFKWPRPRIRAAGEIDMFTDAMHHAMNDRQNGVRLLGAALSAETPAGQYLELLRLFEQAFAKPKWQLRGKLTQFLNDANMGYARDEIEGWLLLRDRYFHADGSPILSASSADLHRVVGRMEQAAYDVLFNKLRWHKFSRERRNLVYCPVGSTDREGQVPFLTRGHDAKWVMQALDPCGRFPMDLSNLRIPVPQGWWFRSPKEEPDVHFHYSGPIQVREQPEWAR